MNALKRFKQAAGVRHSKTKFDCKCPAHDDKSPSLSVDYRNGKVLFHCQAGCDQEAVRAALGLEWSDMKDTETFKKSPVVAHYDYQDESGLLLYQVLRTESKEFPVRVPNGSGWNWRLNGTRRVLYHLPELRAAIDAGQAVFFVEGEKDVHELESKGLTATTSPGGAGKFRPEYAEALKGAKALYILPDNDSPGHAHAHDVAAAAAAYVDDIRIVQLPVESKEDVTDWLTLHGGTVDELRDIVKNAARFSESERTITHETSGDGAQGKPMPNEDTHVSIWNAASNSFIQIPKPGPDDFHYFEKVGRGDNQKLDLRIDPAKLVDRMLKMGYGKTYIGQVNTSTLIHADGNVLSDVSAEQIKDGILAEIAEHESYQQIRRKLISTSHVYFGRGTLEFMKPMKTDFKRSTPNEAFFYYQNCFVRVTAEGIESLPYSALDRHVWKSQILPRDFKAIDPVNNWDAIWGSDIMRLWRGAMRAGESITPRLKSLLSAVGYLLHDYKDPALAKAICFVDEKISDTASGRSGKSLTAKAIGHMTPAEHIDGRRFKFDTGFPFQTVTPAHRVIHFNDCNEKFPFDQCYSIITDVFDIERKNAHKVTLPYEESPKFILSTNYVIAGKGGSHQDRIFEVEYSDYFNKDYKPDQEMGRRLFDGWDADEWNRFDQVMLYCVQQFLKYGLSGYEHVNLKAKKLKQNTSEQFWDYIDAFGDEIKPGEPVYFGQHRKMFLKAEDTPAGWHGYPRLEDSVTSSMFKKWLIEYGEFKGWEVQTEKPDGGALRNGNGRYIEYHDANQPNS